MCVRRMIAAAGIAASLFYLSTPVMAQDNPLVGGTWVHTEMQDDPVHPNQPIKVAYLIQYSEDGQFLTREAIAGSQASGEVFMSGEYEMTGDASYHAVVEDYGPRTMPPLLGQPGQEEDCEFSFQASDILSLSCGNGTAVEYTRQQ